MNHEIQVLTTAPSREIALRIAEALVELRLAACVQVSGPIDSVYRWKGKTEQASEWRCEAKTRQELYRKVEEEIRRLHPYEVPEIIALPIVAGSPDYLQWLTEETAPGAATPPALP